MGKEVDGKQLIKEAKNKVNKKDGNMKKIDWKTTKIVLITLAVIAWFFIGSIAGWNAKSWFNENVKSEVKALSAVVSKE